MNFYLLYIHTAIYLPRVEHRIARDIQTSLVIKSSNKRLSITHFSISTQTQKEINTHIMSNKNSYHTHPPA